MAFAGILLSHFICAQLLIIGGKIDASYLFSLCKVDAGEELHQVRAYYTEAVVATCKKAKVLESSYSSLLDYTQKKTATIWLFFFFFEKEHSN